MNTNRTRYIHVAASVLGAGLALIVVLAAVGGSYTRAAPLHSPGTGSNPEIRYITMTSDLPYYDPTSGDGASKTVYFSNDVSGTITMTFEISGTPTLTLTAGAAFDDLERPYTSESTLFPFAVTYTVAATHTTQPGIVYTAANAGGNQTTVAITYVRDISAPTVPVLHSPVSGTLTNTAAITFEWNAASDGDGSGVAGYNLDLDGTIYTATGSFTATTLPGDGVYTWTVRAYDHLGHYSNYTDTWKLTADTTPATVTITTTSQLISVTAGSLFTITGSANDGLSGVQAVTLTISGTSYLVGSASSWQYGWSVPEKDYEPYTITAWTQDVAGNPGAPAAPIVITVDNVAPQNPSSVASTVPTDTWTSQSAIPFTWTAGYDRSGVITYYYALTTTWPYTIQANDSLTSALAVTPTLSAGGVYTFYLRTVDVAGNWATDTLHLGPFKPDTTPPVVTITTPISGSVLTTTHLSTHGIAGTATDPPPAPSGLAVVSVTTGLGWYTATGTSDWAYTWTLPITDYVPYTISARARNGAGNVSLPVSVTIRVDTVAPLNPAVVTTTNGIVMGTWLATSTVPVSWTAVSDGSGVGYYYRWDQNSGGVVTGTDLYTLVRVVTGTLFQGDNWFHLRTRDGAGNWTTDTVPLGPFKVDTAPPTVTLITPASGTVLTTTRGLTITVSGTVTDGVGAVSGVSAVSVTLDGGATYTSASLLVPAWSYVWNLPQQEDNVPHALGARARDGVGNVGLSSASGITVDMVAPTATVALDAGEWSITSTLVFTWTPSNDGAGIAGYYVVITTSTGVTAVNNAFATSSVYTFSGATEGVSYYAKVKAQDKNGNVGAYGPTSDGIKPDLTNPAVAYGSPPIYESSPNLYAVGSTVYYTNASPAPVYFYPQGMATDTASGPGWITATPALATSSPVNLKTWDDWQFDYRINPGTTASGQITVTVYDAAGRWATRLFTYTFDGTPPYTGSVVINGGATYVTQTGVTLALSAADAGCGVAEMCTSNSGAACAAWESYATAKSWSLDGAGDGTKTVYVWFRDHLANTSGPYSDTIVLDRQPPANGSVKVNGDAPYTNQVTVTLTLTATDATSGVDVMQFSNDGTTWSGWEAFATAKAWTLDGTGDGTKTVYVQFRDRAGNPTVSYTDTIALDRQPPINGSVKANGDAPYTNQVTVTLTLTATDATSGVDVMRFSNDGTTWSGWEAFATAKTWTLDGTGDGTKTVYVQFRDRAGNPTGSYSDAIVLDRRPPTNGSVKVNADALYTNQVLVTLTLTATDATSGLDVMRFSNDDTTWSGWEAFATAKTWTLDGTGDGTKTVYVQFRDRAGNPTGSYSDTIFLDREEPIVTVTVPIQIATTPISVRWAASDPLPSSGNLVYDVAYQEDGGAWLMWQSGVTFTAADFISATLGHTYTFSVTARDGAGNPGNGQGKVLFDYFRVYIPLTLRNYPARPVGSVSIEGGASTVYQQSVTLSLNATVVGDTVDKMRFSNDGTNWSTWEPYAATRSSWPLAGGISGPRTVYAQFMGSKGGVSDPVSDQVYLSLNGNFESGSVAPGWQRAENPLPVSIVQGVQERPTGSTPPADGSYAVLLGQTNYPCDSNGVPLGYAAIEQAFDLPSNVSRLTFKYIIWSQDASMSNQYDRFEVYVNGELRFSDGNVVNNLGCSNWWRVPGPNNPRGGQTGGWATGEIDLTSYAGQSVTISFRNYSRYDGWYNTYTYIDSVAIEGGW